jgi:alpha-ketoglutarate-dependent taurine dioxygenase
MTSTAVFNLVRSERLEITPVQPALGAEVSGVDLKRPLADDVRDAIKAALLKYKVLFLRDQDISHAEHVRFASAFGPLYPHPTAPAVEGFPHRIARNQFPPASSSSFPDRKFAGPAVYHSDTSWRFIPTWGVVLKGVKIPEIGGDTIWVDAEKAYANLSDEFKVELDGKFATHDFRDALHKAGKDYPVIAHPIVRTHPETGAKIL